MNSTTGDAWCVMLTVNSLYSKGADDITVAYMGTVYYASQRRPSLKPGPDQTGNQTK